MLGESCWLPELELGLLSTSHSIYQPSESPGTHPSSLPLLKVVLLCATRKHGYSRIDHIFLDGPGNLDMKD